MNPVQPPRLAIPDADLDALSFCDTDSNALAEWVFSLPMAHTADSAAQVRQATWELARLQASPVTRMALLEQIRPILHYLCARLDRNATISASHGDSIARLAQRLQTNLCSGYKVVVTESLTELAQGQSRHLDRDLLPLALHRALSDLSRTLLRTLQFYVEPAHQLWLELNQLYLLAERLGIADVKLEDAENHSLPHTTPANAYLRSALLASCNPNQLRYRQLAEVFNCLESWAPLVSLEPDATSALLAVDLESDRGPLYKGLLHDAVQPRGIRSDMLVYELEALLRGLPCSIGAPEGSSDLLRQLADAWGTMQPRAHRRSRTGGTVKLCVGLRATHYYLSGGVEFAEQLSDPDTEIRREINPFLVDLRAPPQPRAPGTKDVWDDAFDLKVRIPENPGVQDPERILLHGSARSRPGEDAARSADSKGYDLFDTTAIDTSPGGYQLRWNDPLPVNLQTGELAALREAEDERWCIAIIRWIRQNEEGTAMGIELLSPRAIAVAVRVIQKLGGPTSYTRALLLPALTPIHQPATLITPRVPFLSGQKIHLQRQGIQSTAQLQKCILRTESVSQFTYRMLAGYLENAERGLNMNARKHDP